MNIDDRLKFQQKYITENNHKKICTINLYCFEFNLYKNGIEYLQQFICYLYRS